MFLFVRWVSILLEVFEIAVDMSSIFETTQYVKKIQDYVLSGYLT